MRCEVRWGVEDRVRVEEVVGGDAVAALRTWIATHGESLHRVHFVQIGEAPRRTPTDIYLPADGVFVGCYGSIAFERIAALIVRYFQAAGIDWRPFTTDELAAFIETDAVIASWPRFSAVSAPLSLRPMAAANILSVSFLPPPEGLHYAISEHFLAPLHRYTATKGPT
jgi:hypothetical protein